MDARREAQKTGRGTDMEKDTEGNKRQRHRNTHAHRVKGMEKDTESK